MQTKFFTVNEAAPLLSLCEQSVRNYIKRGFIKASKLARRYVIPEKEIDRLLTEGIQEQK